METDGPPTPNNVIFGEIQVLLAEKRTALASLHTGIAVFALPLFMLSALIATSRYYSIERVMPLLVPLILLNPVLVVLGTWLLFRSIHHTSLRRAYPGTGREIPFNRAIHRVVTKGRSKN
jgi:uncharacterized membrane protein YidH (DUF202 family)